MSTTLQFPHDENGDVLRRMYEGGDVLTKPRIIDFCFIFSDRQQALAFARDVDGQDLEVCISYFQEKASWQVIVKHMMVPAYGSITAMETTLTAKAHTVGGSADGWGCMRIQEKYATEVAKRN